MNLTDYIQKGIDTTGSKAELSRKLEMIYNNVNDAHAGRRGLPAHACVKLAEIIGVDPMEIIAASELVTEKKPERQALWKRVLETRHVAAVCTFFVVTGFLTPENSSAFDNKYLSSAKNGAIYIMSNYTGN